MSVVPKTGVYDHEGGQPSPKMSSSTDQIQWSLREYLTNTTTMRATGHPKQGAKVVDIGHFLVGWKVSVSNRIAVFPYRCHVSDPTALRIENPDAEVEAVVHSVAFSILIFDFPRSPAGTRRTARSRTPPRAGLGARTREMASAAVQSARTQCEDMNLFPFQVTVRSFPLALSVFVLFTQELQACVTQRTLLVHTTAALLLLLL